MAFVGLRLFLECDTGEYDTCFVVEEGGAVRGGARGVRAPVDRRQTDGAGGDLHGGAAAAPPTRVVRQVPRGYVHHLPFLLFSHEALGAI